MNLHTLLEIWREWAKACPCPLQMPSELLKRTELQECVAKNELLEQKLRKVEGKLEQVETIKCNLDLQVTALSSNLGQAEARINMMRHHIGTLAAEREATQTHRSALHRENRDLTTKCSDARDENRALHRQVGDLTTQKQEADHRVHEIQVTNSVMSPDT